MGSGESHFNVSLVVRDKVTRQCPQTTTFLKRKESRSGIEPRPFRLPAYTALALDQTGSLCDSIFDGFYIALFSALEETQCLHVACDSE